MRAELDIHGVGVHLAGDADAVEELAVHFSSFRIRNRSVDARLEVRLVRAAPLVPTTTRWRADQVLERGIVYNSGQETWIDHHGRAVSHYDYAREHGEVTSPETADLVELGYLMVHSRLGVMLERRGLVRAHGVAFSVGGRAALVLTPSGGGKSRLALALLRRPEVRLLSDDLVLLDGRGRVFPFPHPIGISDPVHANGLGRPRPFVRRQHGPKWIIELDELRDRHETRPVPLRLLVAASRVNVPPSRVLPAPRRLLAAALWRDVVVGLGLPQVLELLARSGARDLWRQAPSALLRARIASVALRRARTLRLEVADPDSAARELLEALRSESRIGQLV